MAIQPISDRHLMNKVACPRASSLWLLLAVGAVLGGCDSRQGTAHASVERQTWANTQAARSISGDPARGRQIAQEKCSACHGLDGNGGPDPHVPKLAGQSLLYLYWEFRAFKEGVRKSDLMTPNATALAYDDIADVATYFSQQIRKPDVLTVQGRAAWGKNLFFTRMPSCAMCHSSAGKHGMPMMGMMGGGMMGGGMMGSGAASVPRLQGQHAAYIVDQLNRFATGERKGMVMNRMAASLGEADKQAVAEFLSSTSQ